MRPAKFSRRRNVVAFVRVVGLALTRPIANFAAHIDAPGAIGGNIFL